MKTHKLYKIKYNQNNSNLKYGQFGIKVVSFDKITQVKLNAIDRLVTNFLKNLTNNKKEIKIWKPIVFNFTLTKLSSESRMGKGKGSAYTKAIFLKPGTVLFEIKGITFLQVKEVFQFIEKNVSFKIKLIKDFK